MKKSLLILIIVFCVSGCFEKGDDVVIADTPAQGAGVIRDIMIEKHGDNYRVALTSATPAQIKLFLDGDYLHIQALEIDNRALAVIKTRLIAAPCSYYSELSSAQYHEIVLRCQPEAKIYPEIYNQTLDIILTNI